MKKWWRRIPRSRSHIFKNLPLQFSGANNKISPKTIQLMHDRAEILTFKMFHTGNVNVSSKPIKRVEKREEDGVHSTLDFNWEAPTSLSQVTERESIWSQLSSMLFYVKTQPELAGKN